MRMVIATGNYHDTYVISGIRFCTIDGVKSEMVKLVDLSIKDVEGQWIDIAYTGKRPTKKEIKALLERADTEIHPNYQ